MARYLDIALADYDAAAAQVAQAKRAKQQAKRNAQALGGQVDLAPKLRGAEAIAAANAAGSAAVGAGSGGAGVANDAPTAWQVALGLPVVKPLVVPVVL